MTAVLGTSWPVLVGFTGILMGWVAFMTGQAVARAWRPAIQVGVYAIMLGMADRFLVYALFDGNGLSLAGFLVDTLWLGGVSLLAWRVTLARRMTLQYPWLYERAGLFGWRDRRDHRIG